MSLKVLEELEQAVKSNRMKDMQDLTSRFYTVIPHNFGRQRPPTISNLEVLQKKMDMLAVSLTKSYCLHSEVIANFFGVRVYFKQNVEV